MKKKILIMGIETSCDETAVSIIQDNGTKPPKILANIVSSQEEVHKEFGGVVPEIASRAHLQILQKKTLKNIKQEINNGGKIILKKLEKLMIKETNYGKKATSH